jgi:hypothetical protein
MLNREAKFADMRKMSPAHFVTPAQAGVQSLESDWIPAGACPGMLKSGAGMTKRIDQSVPLPGPVNPITST